MTLLVLWKEDPRDTVKERGESDVCFPERAQSAARKRLLAHKEMDRQRGKETR